MAGHDHEGHRGRLRDRFLAVGLDGFADHEVLELLLTYAIPRKDVKPIAYQLMDRFGSLAGVLAATPQQLSQVPGIGMQSAILISAVLQISRHAEHRQQSGRREAFRNMPEARAYCQGLFAGQTEEVLFVICLDAQQRVIQSVPAIRGTIDEIPIYTRIVVKTALQYGAYSVVLAHNHPSGVCEPSPADIETTDALQIALSTVEISLYDHLIYADGQCVSMNRWRRDHAPVNEPIPMPGYTTRAADTKQSMAKPKGPAKQKNRQGAEDDKP